MESAQKWQILGQKRHFWPSAAPETPHGWKKWKKLRITVEHMWGDYCRCKTCQKNAPNGMEMAQKWLILGKKTPFLAIHGPKGFRWLVKVDQRVDHSGTHVGGLL